MRLMIIIAITIITEANGQERDRFAVAETLAIARVSALGYDVPSLDRSVSERPLLWDSVRVAYRFFANVSPEEAKSYRRKLGNRKCWVFWFFPRQDKDKQTVHFGHEVWVFVEAEKPLVRLVVRAR